MTAEAQTIIRALSSYTEISPSGTGVHILLRGRLPSRGGRKGHVEIYGDGRYFTVTGQQPRQFVIREPSRSDHNRLSLHAAATVGQALTDRGCVVTKIEGAHVFYKEKGPDDRAV